MTVDPFRKHFKKVRLLRFSKDLIVDEANPRTDGFVNLVQLSGKIIKVTEHELFTEVTVEDVNSGFAMPVISFDSSAVKGFEIDLRVICTGTIHLNWTPDMRNVAHSFNAALKSISIKPARL